jgi:hypothetical protein
VIRRVIHRGIYAVSQCWTQESGDKITVRFVIDARGHVASVQKVDRGTGLASVDKCILNAVKGLTFPASTGGRVVVTYPFIVQRAGG